MNALALALLVGAAPARAQAPQATEPAVLSGIDVLAERGFADLKGKKVGLITNQTGLDRHGRSSLVLLANAPNVTVAAIFSPEHGFAGVSEDSSVASGSFAMPDGRSVPLYSLYGATRAPTAEMLSGVDALVFDIQDIGTRSYTYATTMALAMEAAARANIDFVVLDRPDPINGDVVEGPMLEEGLRDFVAYLPVPIRHGMTLGELARLYNVTARLGAKLTVVPLKGWRRSMWYDQTGLPWTRPSPNMPDLDSATLYPGLVMFEAFNVSVGRGTGVPFRWVGAPWLDAKAAVKRLKKERLSGVDFEVRKETPSKDVYKGVPCQGVLMRVTDRDAVRPVTVWAHLAAALRDEHRRKLKADERALALRAGTRRVAQLFEKGASAAELEQALSQGLADFKTQRGVFLLY